MGQGSGLRGLEAKELSTVTSIRINRLLWIKAKKYAKSKGMSMSMLVSKALQSYMERDEKMLNEFELIRRYLKEIRDLLRTGQVKSFAVAEVKPSYDELPEYARNNPWIRVLSGRSGSTSP